MSKGRRGRLRNSSAAGMRMNGLSGQPPSTTPGIPMAYRAVRGGLWVAASSYWTTGVGFAATLVLTRLLAPEVFGVFALGTLFAQLVRLLPKLDLELTG